MLIKRGLESLLIGFILGFSAVVIAYILALGLLTFGGIN